MPGPSPANFGRWMSKVLAMLNPSITRTVNLKLRLRRDCRLLWSRGFHDEHREVHLRVIVVRNHVNHPQSGLVRLSMNQTAGEPVRQAELDGPEDIAVKRDELEVR